MNTFGEIANSIVTEQIISLEEKNMFEKNIASFKRCKGFHGNFLQGKIPFEMMTAPVESRIKSFLAQAESDLPILLHDAYEIDELEWMCDKLRYSDRYGSDNHLYLMYSSNEEFIRSMKSLDWSYIAETDKAIFIFDEKDKEKYYPSRVVVGEPLLLDVSEIKEIIESIPNGYSGSDFFNMILDSHPFLLTIGWQGLCCYWSVWKVFCENKTVLEAVENMKNPQNKSESELLRMNVGQMLKYKARERMAPFLDSITNYLDPDKKYDQHDWFVAFFLSCNEVTGKKFKQRISPSVFYDRHNMGQPLYDKYICNPFNIKMEEIRDMQKYISKGFKYVKKVGVVRRPLGKIGSMANTRCGTNKRPDEFVKIWLGNRYVYGDYLKKDSIEYKISRHVRFEDLKLYPKETTEKLCEYLRIPWSDTCLHLTANGDDGGVVDGTEGFDVWPVYNPHEKNLSSFDYYRIELLNYKNFSIWGYKTKYYDGIKYAEEDLEKLMSVPFKFETLKYDAYPDWPNEKVSKEFHEWIMERVRDILKNGDKDPKTIKGNNMEPVECLFPDLKPGQQLFER